MRTRRSILILIFALFSTAALAGIKTEDTITGKKIATPANPASGYTTGYFKSDEGFYRKTSGGVETLVGPGVSTISKSGSAALTGAVTLTGGSNVTLTQSGQDISFASTGGTPGGNQYDIQTNNGSGGFTGDDGLVYKSGMVGIGQATPLTKISILDGSSTSFLPNTGTTPTSAIINMQGGVDALLYIGSTNASPYGWWFQSADDRDLSTHYPIYLNPNGGPVAINTTASPQGSLDVNGHGGSATEYIRSDEASGGEGASTHYVNTGSSGREFSTGSSSDSNGTIGGGKHYIQDIVTNLYAWVFTPSAEKVEIGQNSGNMNLDVHGNIGANICEEGNSGSGDESQCVGDPPAPPPAPFAGG